MVSEKIFEHIHTNIHTYIHTDRHTLTREPSALNKLYISCTTEHNSLELFQMKNMGAGSAGAEALKAKHYIFVGDGGAVFFFFFLSIQWAVGFCDNV